MDEIERMGIEHKYRMEEIEAITKLLNNTQKIGVVEKDSKPKEQNAKLLNNVQKTNIAEEEYVNSTPASLGLSTKSSSSANIQPLPKPLKKETVKKAGFFKRLFKKNNDSETFNPVSEISSELVGNKKAVRIESAFAIPEVSEDKLILDFPNIDVKKCPVCQSKTLKSKVKKDKESDKLFQFVKCSNIECNFQKKIEVSTI